MNHRIPSSVTRLQPLQAVAWLAVAVGVGACGPVLPNRTGTEGIVSTTSVSAPNDRSITFDHAGSHNDPRVIYVHGTPGDRTGWIEYLKRPEPGLESIAIDRPGFGESLPKTGTSSLAQQAAAIKPLLVRHHGKWPILVGHSLGAPIIARVAADYPDRVAGLVIVSGSLDPAQEQVNPLQYLGEVGPVAAMLPRALRSANEELIPLRGELEKLGAVLGRIKCPIIIIHGTRDPLVPFANVAYMQTHFPAGTIREVVEVKGANHFLPWNHELVIRSAIERLAGTDPSGADSSDLADSRLDR